MREPPPELEVFEYDPVNNILYFFGDEEGLDNLEWDIHSLLKEPEHFELVTGYELSEQKQRHDTVLIEFIMFRHYIQPVSIDPNSELELVFEYLPSASVFMFANTIGINAFYQHLQQLKQDKHIRLTIPFRGCTGLTTEKMLNDDKTILIEEVHLYLK